MAGQEGRRIWRFTLNNTLAIAVPTKLLIKSIT
jgi:hypothetical protein